MFNTPEFLTIWTILVHAIASTLVIQHIIEEVKSTPLSIGLAILSGMGFTNFCIRTMNAIGVW